MKVARISSCLVAAGLMLSAGGVEASVVNLIVNGGFETGSLAGWTAVSSNADTGGCNSGWTVSGFGAATGCSGVSNPLGSKAAYQSFDGYGPKTRTLSQSFVVPELGSALLQFWDSYSFNIVLGKELPRSLDVNIVSGGVTENVFHFLSPVGFGTGYSAFTLQSVDLTDVLFKHVGETVQLAFVTTIPETFSGPAGLGLDNISLNLTEPVAKIPEPASLGLLGLGLAGLSLIRRRKA